MISRSLACGFEINGNVCARVYVGLGESPPRVGVEFECVLALAHELRRAGEGPPFGGRDEGHHRVCPESSSATAAAAASTSWGRGGWGVLRRREDERAPRRPVLRQFAPHREVR